jgi:hypothetical protein
MSVVATAAIGPAKGRACGTFAKRSDTTSDTGHRVIHSDVGASDYAWEAFGDAMRRIKRLVIARKSMSEGYGGVRLWQPKLGNVSLTKSSLPGLHPL